MVLFLEIKLTLVWITKSVVSFYENLYNIREKSTLSVNTFRDDKRRNAKTIGLRPIAG